MFLTSLKNKFLPEEWCTYNQCDLDGCFRTREVERKHFLFFREEISNNLSPQFSSSFNGFSDFSDFSD